MKRLALLALLVPACKPRFEELTLSLASGPPAGARADADEIELPVGLAALVEADLRSASRVDYERGEDPLELRSDDEQILIVEPTERAWEFVLIAVAVGETCVQVIVDGDSETCIPARVVAQE